MAAHALWRIPGCFGIANMLGRDYSLRCVLFHHISEKPSPFTAGIRVAISPKNFEDALRFLTAHYVPVSLEDVLNGHAGHKLPHRAVLVTFDDAYASVPEVAAPLCRQYRVPAVFFVNAAFVDNQRLAPDNLICYVASNLGMETINAAAVAATAQQAYRMRTIAEVFGVFLPSITLAQRDVFLDALCRLSGVDECRLAREANLYLTQKQLRGLGEFNIEIGNHTYTHTHCRRFTKQDLALEVDRNKAELETMSASKVRSFSQPYGSSWDLTHEMVEHLERSGHQVAFLSESVANSADTDLFHLDRISTCVESDGARFFELEVLPRLRANRNRLCLDLQTRRPGRFSSSAGPQKQKKLDGFVNG